MGKKVLMDMEIVQSTMHEDDLAKSLYCSLTLKGQYLHTPRLVLLVFTKGVTLHLGPTMEPTPFVRAWSIASRVLVYKYFLL